PCTIASTARAISGISVATAAATLRSSRFIKRTISMEDKRSRLAEAGLRRSLRRLSERMDIPCRCGTRTLYRRAQNFDELCDAKKTRLFASSAQGRQQGLI